MSSFCLYNKRRAILSILSEEKKILNIFKVMVVKSIIDTQRAGKDGLFPVKLRFAGNGKSLYCAVGVRGELTEFDSKMGLFRTDNKATKIKNNYSNQIILASIRKVEDIILRFVLNNEILTVDILKRIFISSNSGKREIVVEKISTNNTISFVDYFEEVIHTKNAKNAEIYQGTLNKIKIFTKDSDLTFTDITSRWLDNFDYFMSKQLIESKNKKKILTGLSINTRAIHLKNIRSVLNKALNDEIVTLPVYPFKTFRIKIEDTQKRAMKINDIQILFSYIGSSQENWAIDIAKIIFFSIGINVKDLFFLSDIDENLSYRRFKTHRLYSIPIEPELKAILNKYMVGDSLVFKKQFVRYESFSKKINKYLKLACLSIGIPQITTYSLRHSWATIANKLGVNKNIIAQALGHGKKTVTDIYILEDIEDIQKANRLVIDFVLNK